MMQQRGLLILSVLIATAFVVQQTAAKCNTCGANGIACINDTSFYLCTDGVMNTASVFSCPSGRNCTALDVKCAANTQADCSVDMTGCGVCDGQKMFACISRTTFSMCNGTVLMTDVTGTCPDGRFCDSKSAEICVTECSVTTDLECDIDAALIATS